MNKFCGKDRSTHWLGIMFLLLGATAAPSQATTLTSFSTFGSDMAGIRVTANFLNGTSESLIWGATSSVAGGVFGTGWSLTQSGNTYLQLDDPNGSRWTLTNSSANLLSSLVIDTIPGNTVFDILPTNSGPNNTPNSAEGWAFQTTFGLAPTSYNYLDPIDISQGDLFGRLVLDWTTGFTGAMQFLADTDSGRDDDPVQPAAPTTRDTPPAVIAFNAPTIYEGQAAPASVVQAIDSGADALTFLLNGTNIGTDYNRTPGAVRQAVVNFGGIYADNGDFAYTVYARDENGFYSAPASSVLRVLNVAPTVTNLVIPTIYEGQSASAYMSATDPGADYLNFYLNGSYMGTDYATTGTRAINANLGYFADNTYVPYTGYTQDKDGAWSTPVASGLTVLNVAPTLTSFDLSQSVIYEGQSVSAFMTASDPGADWQNFFINNAYVATDWQTSGMRSASTNLGSFGVGTYTFTSQAQDKDGDYSNVITRTLQVLNIAPTLTAITQNLVTTVNSLFDFVASAVDPGTSNLTYEWDFDGDGTFDDFAGAGGQWSFAEVGTYDVNVRVSDGNGGYTYGSFTVSTVPEESVPEPSTVVGFLALSGCGAAVWKRKKQQKAKDSHLK
jgi:hypothetical protein